MRWTPGRRSTNLEDRRFERRGRAGLRRGVPMGLGGLLVILALSLLFRQNLFTLLDPSLVEPGAGGEVGGGPMGSPATGTASPEEEELADFVSFVLDDNQATWARVLPDVGESYRDTQLVLFRDAIESACGYAASASGPFYCPADEKIYIDLGFYDELRRRFGAPGDFAQAYVVAHEIGHHVQHLLGVDTQVRRLQADRPELENDLSVRMELQADCFAGVWGHSTARRQILERGDVEEGLSAAAAIGDDRIQRMSRGTISPDAFTHGSAEQRVRWFRRGLSAGDPGACDTFGIQEP